MLSQKIKTRMEELKLSQAELARRSELSPGYINDLLSGRRGSRISRETTTKLKGALRVPFSFFDPTISLMQNRTIETNSGGSGAEV